MASACLKIFILLFFSSFPGLLMAEVDMHSTELSLEYGFSYLSVEGLEKSNNTKGRLTTNQFPYLNSSLMQRVNNKLGIKFNFGMQFTQFTKSPNFALENQNLLLLRYGLETFYKLGPYSRIGFFLDEQERPLYFANSPTDITLFKRKFVQPGVNYGLTQRRRVGLLWGLNGKFFLMTPSSGGDIATETGAGAEVAARLGFVGPLGTLYQIRGFYNYATAPNALVSFTQEELGYGILIQHTW